jgi:transcriptional regulator with XRE-family HTH domain
LTCGALRVTSMKINIVPMYIGQVIREIRETRGATLEEIALAADTNASNLSRIERGKQGFSPETLERIATALGVTVSELHLRVEAARSGALSGQTTDSPGQGAESRFPSASYAALSQSNRDLLDDFIALLLKRQRRGMKQG